MTFAQVSRDTVKLVELFLGRAVVARRLAEVRAGAVRLVDADEHHARLRVSLTT